MAKPSSPPERRSHVAVAAIGFMVVTSAVVRSVFAWRHPVPRLFPDEYIYTALSRSIGHGHLEIRGQTVHFPAIIEPILAAPFWRLFPVATAYHLVQVENAVFASLTAIPLYFLARSLRLSQGYSVFVAAFGLVMPELVLTSYTTADAIGFPLAIGAVAAANSSLALPTTGRQVGFIVLAVLATLTRAEYFALAPAYLVAALVLDRGWAWRRHRVALSALVPVSGLAILFAFGYYLTGHQGAVLHTNYVGWFFVQLFLVAIELGVAVVPGVVAGLLKPRTRLELVFAVLFGAFALLVFIAATKPGAEKQEFKERYLFALIALTPIAYGFYMRNGRPLRRVAIAVAIVIGVSAAQQPLTQYATSTFKSDSQFLFAINETQNWVGAGNSSLIVALLAALGAILAVVLTFRGNLLIPLGVAMAVSVFASVVATNVDIREAREVRAQLPANLSWVDTAAHGKVTAIETQLAVKSDLLSALYWNPSIQREVLLGAADPTDAFSAPRLVIGRGGQLEGVHGDVLFHDYGATGVVANSTRIASHSQFTLWRPTAAAPRFRLVIEGRFWDAWLGSSGRLRAWPGKHAAAVRLSFRLSLPQSWRRPIPRVTIGKNTFVARPGHALAVECTSNGGPLDISFSSTDGWLAPDFRHLTARMTRIVAFDAAPRRHGAPPCAVG